MRLRRSDRAARPPADLPGLDPAWSRLVPVSDADGVHRTFHVLDSWASSPGGQPDVTLFCLHGNPTWSYLWRRLLAQVPANWRVIAPDHLGMGYSDRPAEPRTVAQRLDDLDQLTDAMQIQGPVITVAHDWGGILSMGWAQRHAAAVVGVVLTNTAVHLPPPARGPVLIRLARLPLLNRVACRWTPLFVRATTSLTWPRIPAAVRAAFAAPYTGPGSRAAVAEFVRDIPFLPGHPSYPVVAAIAAAMPGMDVPALLLWGPRDPVFGEVFLRDLQTRLPGAVLHRYEKASHLLPEDAPGYAAAVIDWVRQLGSLAPADHPTASVDAGGSELDAVPHECPAAPGLSPLAALDARSGSTEPAAVEVGGATITWAQLHARVESIGAGLAAAGVGPGSRVALLVPPSIELTVALYAIWRAGGVIVVADKGLGLRAMGRALRSARLDFLVADYPGLLVAPAMRLPGVRIAVQEPGGLARRVTGAALSLPELARIGAGRPRPPESVPDDEAAVLFTSGATGPAKGVLYRQRQVRAQLQLVVSGYGLTAQDRLVAAFAPFALFGPALGMRSAVPDVDVTRPATLTAVALADAAITVDATVVFASPAALRNVLLTSAALTTTQRSALAKIRLVASFGAPIPVSLLRSLGALLPAASLRTPYGMTEAFPLTDISLEQIEEAGAGDGVCVGRPLPGVQIRIAPLGGDGQPGPELSGTPAVSGEVWARARHMRDRYDSLWLQNHSAAGHPGWHRTGDVGYLDDQGRLWIQGRLEHVIASEQGPVTPVGIEQRVLAAVQELAAGRPTSKRSGPSQDVLVAAVGVGPVGIAQVVVVVTGRGGPLAPADVTDVVRRAAGHPVAAVLVKKALPLDIRHHAKIDRSALARWAADVLAGG